MTTRDDARTLAGRRPGEVRRAQSDVGGGGGRTGRREPGRGCVDVRRGAPRRAAPTTTGLVLNYRFDTDTGSSPATRRRRRSTAATSTPRRPRPGAPGMPGQSWAIRLVGATHQYVAVPERNALDVDRFTAGGFVNPTGVENDQTFERWEVLEKAGAYWMNIRTNGRVRVGGFFGGCTNPAWKYLDSTVTSRTTPGPTWPAPTTAACSGLVNGVRAGSRAMSGTTCQQQPAAGRGGEELPRRGAARGLLGRPARRRPDLPAGALGRRGPGAASRAES